MDKPLQAAVSDINAEISKIRHRLNNEPLSNDKYIQLIDWITGLTMALNILRKHYPEVPCTCCTNRDCS